MKPHKNSLMGEGEPKILIEFIVVITMNKYLTNFDLQDQLLTSRRAPKLSC